MNAPIRISARIGDERVSTYYLNGKWMTFYRFGGLLIEYLESLSFHGAGINHLEFLKKIRKRKEFNEQEKITKSSISEAPVSFQGLEETSKIDGEQCAPSSNQEGQDGIRSSDPGGGKQEAVGTK